MNEIEKIIKLHEAGISAEDIQALLNKGEEKVEKVEEIKKEEEKIEDVKASTESPAPELNAFKEMMTSFENHMQEQMKAFKESIQLSNQNLNLGSNESTSRNIAEQFTAKIINPSYNKEEK